MTAKCPKIGERCS